MRNDEHMLLVEDEAEVQGYDATSFAVYATVLGAAVSTYTAGVAEQEKLAKAWDMGYRAGVKDMQHGR
jgi:hypothetical protein